MPSTDPDRALIGKRVEIPAHCDNWMRGDRFGRVTSLGANSDSGLSIRIIRITGDKGTKTRLRLDEFLQYGRVL